MILTERFHRTYLILYSMAVGSAFFLSSYLKYPITSAVSYSINDGWCRPKEQGIGEHCFGDYYYSLFLQEKTFPWGGSPNPYPPFALEIYRPFQLLESYSNSRVGLSVYIFMLALCVILPILFLLKRLKTTTAEFTTLILGTIASAPFFVILDRGNSSIIVFPILILWMLSIRKEQYGNAAALTVAASLFRPQFILLALIFLFVRKPNLFIRTIVSSAALTLISFLVYGSNARNNLWNWLQQIFGYQDYAAVASVFPVNISLSNTLSLAMRLFSIPIPLEWIKVINLACFIAFVIIYWIKSRSLSPQLRINACLIAPTFFISTTFHYYFFVISLILLNSILDSTSKLEIESQPSAAARIYQFLTCTIFMIVLIPWALPWSLFPGLSASRGWPVIGVHWVLAEAVFAVYALVTLLFYPLVTGRIKK